MKFIKESFIRATSEHVFAFHEQPEVLKLLTPPWESSRVISTAKISELGSRSIIETKILGMTVRWVAEHTAYDPPHMFEDVQIEGPFRSWQHTHLINANGEGALLRDEIDYEPPFGFLGRLGAPLLIEPRLKKLFEYRHRVTTEWCEQGSPQNQN